MAARQVQIDRRVREVRVAEEELDGTEIGAGFEQVRGVRVSQRVGG